MGILCFKFQYSIHPVVLLFWCLSGGIAIPAAVVGIMVGGYLLKRFQMSPKGQGRYTCGWTIGRCGWALVLYFLVDVAGLLSCIF